ncbi:MAG: FG-GAP repeat domain-containing protein [Myxococcota bacterium]
MNRAFVLLCLTGCLDYDLNGEEDKPDGMSDPEDTDEPTSTTGSTCDFGEYPAEAAAPSDTCDYEIGGFEPVVKWEVEGPSNALPTVGDLDGDGIPEVLLVAQTTLLGKAEVRAYRGDTGDEVWVTATNDFAYGSHPAIADIDADGSPEIFMPREYSSSLWGSGEYSLVMLDANGNEVAESDSYTDDEFDYASGPIVSDMDHDGSPEIVVGRVIFNADLTERAKGRYGRGCPAYVGIGLYGEGAQPAVADLDLDGVEEVITGDSIFGPDGEVIWNDRSLNDAAAAVANLDGDPEGEFVASSYNEIRFHDTDGTILWGPTRHPTANILSPPAIGDVDGDGEVEIVIAGGNELWVLNADGSELWTARVHDESGATGASIFDFDADGVPEIVYIDEIQMIAFNGTDGAIKFQSDKHGSATMYDYPVIADIDADGHAEIAVTHDWGYATGLSIYEDVNDSWAPVRKLWNQHNYTITNINDDLTVPVTATQNFTVYNSWHSAIALEPGETLGDELEGEILDVCRDDCDRGVFWVVGRVLNTGNGEIPAGVAVSLYAEVDGQDVLLDTQLLEDAVPSEMTSEALTFRVDTSLAEGADGLVMSVDDDGTGTGLVSECLEDNNRLSYSTTLCE